MKNLSTSAGLEPIIDLLWSVEEDVSDLDTPFSSPPIIVTDESCGCGNPVRPDPQPVPLPVGSSAGQCA